jgi:hypothetical protein
MNLEEEPSRMNIKISLERALKLAENGVNPNDKPNS